MATAEANRPDCIVHAEDFKKMIIGASYFFDREKEAINALNVFPVPDGDTGTNMSLTLAAAAEATLAYQDNSIGELAARAASRALMGARGNSGVILSQFLRGIARGLQGKEQADAGELSKAFQYGVVYAYKAVSRPVEGTILTVARETARGVRAAAKRGDGLSAILEAALAGSRKTLARTTEMLPVLKEAGVVDAGGMGLVVFLEGCIFAVQHTMGEILARKEAPGPAVNRGNGAAAYTGNGVPLEIPYPYCTELLIELPAGVKPELLPELEPLGDSLLVVVDGAVCKVHIHTASPGRVLEICLERGSLHDIKIDNMYDQHSHTLNRPSPVEVMAAQHGSPVERRPNETGILAVSFGEGIKELFLNMGADEIVFGGQTMNPKVEDLVGAVQRMKASRVIILPNNKNIQMVAEQVLKLSEKEVAVLETRNMGEGLAALLAFSGTASLDENTAAMRQAIRRIKCGEVTHAIRDTKIEGKNIKTGSYLGLLNGRICRAGEERMQTTLDLFAALYQEGDEIATILYGKDVTADEAGALAAAVEEAYPGLEVEMHYGGQPVYYYIISVE
ncbi:MAG: DAK2 domain-containing protein [Bacillota bacterium]